MANEVFISYSRKDLERVRKIKSEIDQQVGIDCWMDLDGIASDKQFVKVIINAIKLHDTMLFMLTENSMQSRWALREIGFAEREEKRIVLVDLEHAKMTDEFFFLYQDRDIIDWQSQPQREKLIRNLRQWFGSTGDTTSGNLPLPTTEKTNPVTKEKPAVMENPKPVTKKKPAVTVKPDAQPKNTLPKVLQRLVDNMVHVEGGTFQMGNSGYGNNSYAEQPDHQVTLSSFYIGKYEVTQEEWKAVIGRNPSNFRGTRRPVEMVSWDDCQTFIQRLNQLTGLRFRLPTEAEWEFAARGGNTGKNHGYKYSGSTSIDAVGWYFGNSGNQTHPVGRKQANELGLYDMTGNVWEWCQDWYGSYSSQAQTNPTGPTSPTSAIGRVIRGSSWDGYAQSSRLSYRGFNSPSHRSSGLGLRLAR